MEEVHFGNPKEVKEKAEKILSGLGLPPQFALDIFYRQVILRQGLPFPLRFPTEEDRKEERAAEKENAAPAQLPGKAAAAVQPAEKGKAETQEQSGNNAASVGVKADEAQAAEPAGTGSPETERPAAEDSAGQASSPQSDAAAAQESGKGGMENKPAAGSETEDAASSEAGKADEAAEETGAVEEEAADPQSGEASPEDEPEKAEPEAPAPEEAPAAHTVDKKGFIDGKYAVELRREVESGLFQILINIPAPEEENGREWLGTVVIGDDRMDPIRLSQITNADGEIDTEEVVFSPHVSYIENSYAMKYLYSATAPFSRREMVDLACSFLFQHGVENINYLSARQDERSQMEEIGFTYMGLSSTGLVKIHQFVRKAEF